METAYKKLLNEVLSVIEYDDRETYTQNFEEMNRMEAIMNCLERLPKDMQDAIFEKKDSPEDLKKYVSQDDYIKELASVSAKAFAAFLNDLGPVLSQEEKEKVAHIIGIL